MNLNNTLVFARRAGTIVVEQDPQHALPNDKFYVVIFDLSTTPPKISNGDYYYFRAVFFGLSGIIVPKSVPRLAIDMHGNIFDVFSNKLVMKGPDK